MFLFLSFIFVSECNIYYSMYCGGQCKHILQYVLWGSVHTYTIAYQYTEYYSMFCRGQCTHILQHVLQSSMHIGNIACSLEVSVHTCYNMLCGGQCTHTQVLQHGPWRSENNFQQSAPSFNHVHTVDQPQFVRVGKSFTSELSHWTFTLRFQTLNLEISGSARVVVQEAPGFPLFLLPPLNYSYTQNSLDSV